nr:carbonic anhydrase 5A, mitochondrial isoform X9 [Caretta caretta]
MPLTRHTHFEMCNNSWHYHFSCTWPYHSITGGAVISPGASGKPGFLLPLLSICANTSNTRGMSIAGIVCSLQTDPGFGGSRIPADAASRFRHLLETLCSADCAACKAADPDGLLPFPICLLGQIRNGTGEVTTLLPNVCWRETASGHSRATCFRRKAAFLPARGVWETDNVGESQLVAYTCSMCSAQAACVSMITGSSPSQRLVKLRKKEKRTRDEMFSELMLSSHTDRAQTNAWRQIMSECRKAQNDREERWRAEESKWRAEDRAEAQMWRQRDERRQDSMLRLLQDQTSMLQCMAELQQRQLEHRLPLLPLCNQPPSSPSSIASIPRRPRTRWEGLRPTSHSTTEDCPKKRRLSFSKF